MSAIVDKTNYYLKTVNVDVMICQSLRETADQRWFYRAQPSSPSSLPLSNGSQGIAS